ncbi:hypothetical protein HY772_09280, partial [Candidatus Woesearchaeota archaeon]|nr:hypothetical protein [Candidatus Woesearchaeota archaeon]
ISQNNDQPQETHVLPFLSETVTIPAVIIPENGQPFSTTFDRPRYLNINIQRIEDEIVVPGQEEQRKKIEEAENQISQKLHEEVTLGMTVYRVGGGRSWLFSPDPSDPRKASSWTNLDPRLGHFYVPTSVGPKSYYRVHAGLPNENSGVCLAIGELIDASGLPPIRPAQRIPGYDWHELPGWPEVIITNARLRVRIEPGNECILINPPF